MTLRAGLRPLTGLLRCRWLRWGLLAGTPLLGLGCGSPTDLLSNTSRKDTPPCVNPAPQALRAERAPAVEHGDSTSHVVQASHVEVAPPPVKAPRDQVLAIDLDTVLRLAEEQNVQIRLAREQLHESLADGQAGLAGWLPKITAGMAYYRHEGGIQNPDGTFVNSSTGALYPGLDLQGEFNVRDAIYRRIDAQRKQLQQKGDLTKITNDVLLEALTTYIDLLAARRGEAISLELESFARLMLKRAEDLKKSDPGAAVLYEGTFMDVVGRQQARSRLHQQGDAASAKLAYLLGLPHDVRLLPVEATLTPINLADIGPSTDCLVEQAIAHGPGVHELEQMLAVIQSGQAELEGPISLMPTLNMSMFEGPFGAGTGSNLTWDNRFDAGVQVRWNITELLNAHQKRAVAHSKLMQVELARQDLCGKLTAGVEEAREAILAGREQIHFGTMQLEHASEAYRKSKQRVDLNAPGATITEVMQAIHGLDQAHTGYLSALRDHNKAQIRLLLLLGPANIKKPCVPAAVTGPAGDPHSPPAPR